MVEEGNELKALIAVGEPATLVRAVAAVALDPSIQVDAADTADALQARLAAPGAYDVVLFDFNMPGLVGLKGVHTLRLAIGAAPLGVFLTSGSVELCQRLMNAGAAGVLHHALDARALAHVLHLLADGHHVALFNATPERTSGQTVAQLSERELQVLRGLCDGLQNKEIAHSFSVQEVTVKMHVRAIIRKLNARNRTHAAMIARDLNLV